MAPAAPQPRNAWISGGLGGLGLHFARALLSEGGNVALTDVCAESAALAALRAEYPQQKVLFHTVDVTSEAQVAASMRAAQQSFGTLDLAINNAGVACEADYARTIAVNLTGVIACTRAFGALAHARAHAPADPCVVNVASAAGVAPLPRAPAYSASKHGVVGYTRAVAAAWPRVRVAALCPAWVDAGMGRAAPREEVAAVGVLDAAEVVDALLRIVRGGRSGEVLYVSKRTGVRFPRVLLDTERDARAVVRDRAAAKL